ncbi:hypothetical protein VR7878_00355 [Vibrio ruber DSM 16370]|uniref:Uncharacterized protein n=1 Tax=Vibrio ruber (strain DSM 16370 / JCM 11486 / BCRC 17186 / CECT 7878 / LMG 23124 / VR1) TaxID=1123498 RepID=A0A1R4LA61_VIBR1|nr:hypothetical protein VR7878_00355 [Vibrio ruber DSM 16370]
MISHSVSLIYIKLNSSETGSGILSHPQPEEDYQPPLVTFGIAWIASY